jgi:hypothetical protein
LGTAACGTSWCEKEGAKKLWRWTSGARNGPPRNRNVMRASNNASNRNGQQQPYKTYKMLDLELEVEKAKTAKALYANVVKRKPPEQ